MVNIRVSLRVAGIGGERKTVFTQIALVQQGGENAMWNIKATWESVVVIYGSILLLTLDSLLLVIPTRGSLAVFQMKMGKKQ